MSEFFSGKMENYLLDKTVNLRTSGFFEQSRNKNGCPRFVTFVHKRAICGRQWFLNKAGMKTDVRKLVFINSENSNLF